VAQKKYYVVWKGRETGIFEDWPTCQRLVTGFPGAKYKSFKTEAEANAAFGNPAAAKTGGSKPAKKRSSASGKSASGRQTVKTWSATEVDALEVDTKIFTDGGCEPNPGNAGSGMAIYRNGQVSELWYGLYNPNGTNNTAELNALHQAFLKAVPELADGRSVAVLSDSKYSIQCITQWAVNWEKRGWKKADGEIKNLALIQEIYALYQSIKDKVQVMHVNGHVGVEGNELADRMSIKAMTEHATGFSRYGEPINLAEILALRAG